MFLFKERRSAQYLLPLWFEVTVQSSPKLYLRKKQQSSFWKHERSVSYKYVMFKITNLFKPCMGKLILNLWSEIIVQGSAMDFWTVTFSNQSFKHNSAHMPSLNLTHKFPFELRFRIVIIKFYYTKSKRL